jgi:hypothetical protein
MTPIDWNNLRSVLEWLNDKGPFICDCDEAGGYLEYDTNAYIHTDRCATWMEYPAELALEQVRTFLDGRLDAER